MCVKGLHVNACIYMVNSNETGEDNQVIYIAYMLGLHVDPVPLSQAAYSY